MKKLSLLVKPLAICLVIVLFTNSVGYAKAPTIPNAQTRCGEWKIQNVGSNNDQRIGITLKSQASGNDCSGMFTLENRTGTVLGGGYSLALTANSNNANVQYLPYGDPILIPGLNIEIKTIPNDITEQANVNLQGEVTLGSFLAVDLSFFAMKSIIDLVPVPTGCLISYDQILLISLRTAPILENTARLAFEGKLIESKNEFSSVINVFYEKAGDVARGIGIGCFADFLKSILGKPIVIAKVVLSYITWVPVVIFDYFKYQGFLTSVSLSYIPPTPPTPTPMPTKWYIRVYNIDDRAVAYVNGNKIVEVAYTKDSGWIDVTSYFSSPTNRVRFTLWNDPAGYTWGFAIRRNNIVVWQDVQGKASIIGANNNDYSQTNRMVYDHTFLVNEAGEVTIER